MSYEAWGEPEDPAFTVDELYERGWISPDDVSRAAIDVLNERARQQHGEGWSADHDDAHVKGELAHAGASYAVHAVVIARLKAQGVTDARIKALAGSAGVPPTWPWAGAWWKPSDQRRNLVKAAALLLAEIERIDRAEAAGR